MKIQRLLFCITILALMAFYNVHGATMLKEPAQLAKYNQQMIKYYRQGKFKQALFFAKKRYFWYEKTFGKKAPDTIQSLNDLAIIYEGLGQLSNALLLFEKAYSLKKEFFGEKHRSTMISLNNLATFYLKLKLSSKALPLYEKYPKILNRLDSLAVIYRNLGQFSNTLLLLEKSYSLSKKLLGEQHPDTLTSLNNLATIYLELGRLSDALPLLEKSYRLSKEVLGEKHRNTLSSLNNLAALYKMIGQFSTALPLLEKANRLSKEVLGEKHHDTLANMNNLATIYQDLGMFYKALLLKKKVYSIRKKLLGEKHPDTMRSMNNLATIYQDLGRFSEALPLFEKSYRLRKELLGKKHPETITSLNNLAMIYKYLGRLSEALPLLEKSYSLAKEVLGKNYPNNLRSMNNLASIYLELGKINKSIKYYEKVIKGVETLRQTGDFSAENRQTLFKKWVDSYFALSYLYIHKHRSFDAFRLSELSKARTLLESLAAKRAAQESGLSKAEQEKLQDYQARLAFFNNKIAKAIEANRLNDRISLETDKNQLIAELNQFEQNLKEKYPKYAKLSEVQIISADKGAKHLPKNAVFISYLVRNSEVLAFTLDSTGKLTTHNLGVIPNLNKKMDSYHYRLAREKTRNRIIRKKKTGTKQISIKLGKLLLEPLKDIIKDKTHWIISPSGVLALIPFETLHFDGEKQPVIAQHQISYVQSLSIFAMLQKRDLAYKQIQNRQNLFAMGAPIYQETKIVSKSKPKSNDSTSALRQLNLQWQNLPGTLAELSALKNVFKNATIYKQQQATESKLQSLNKQRVLEKYRYLVFSAHGYLSPDIPALSSVVLGQVNNPKGIDGYITAGEWPAYDLKSDLMVLSACETGLGKVVGGEGVLGLPYALFVAGNKNTLLTLWSISDEITVEFMASFFRKLKAGQRQIEALTATKREFINKGGKYANPMYWAAFVLYGV